MRIDFHGNLVEGKEVRAGFIGCGSHSSRNIYPTFQFAPVNLVSVCDLSLEKAKAFAEKYGAKTAYSDYRVMIKKEQLDAVFVVTGYDKTGRPVYPQIAVDCLRAGLHVWIEKPPASSVEEIEIIEKASMESGKNVMVGLKKMFFPANEKAKALSQEEEFGKISMVMLQYHQFIPPHEEFDSYINKKEPGALFGVVSFLDHICHPASLMVFLLGMPDTMYYERNFHGTGIAIFTFPSGAIANIAFTKGAAFGDCIERTMIISNSSKHIIVDNNIRVSYHRMPTSTGLHYGSSPDYYIAPKNETTAIWEPEFSLGQLYNKGLFLLGYYNEINEFAKSIIENRKPVKGTLQDAKCVTRIFEAFANGPNKLIKF